MMRLSWFRMHTEARTDAKLRSLTAEQFRVWFNLLCLAAEQEESRGVIADVDLELLAIEVADGDTGLLEQTLARLVKLRVVSQSDESVAFLNFEKRQYDKPSAAPERVKERVQRYRERQETLERDGVTRRNAPVTPGNAQSRVDKSIQRDNANALSSSDGADASSDTAPSAPSDNGAALPDISDADLAAMLAAADVGLPETPDTAAPSPAPHTRAAHRQDGALALADPPAPAPTPARMPAPVPTLSPSRPTPARRAAPPKTLLPEPSAPIQLAREFRAALLAQLPDARVPADTVAALQAWGRHFDLMIRLDKRGRDDIRAMMAFARAHPFWHRNILCPEKLRAQWDRLTLERREQQQREERSRYGTHGQHPGAHGADTATGPTRAPRNTINGYVPSRHQGNGAATHPE